MIEEVSKKVTFNSKVGLRVENCQGTFLFILLYNEVC